MMQRVMDKFSCSNCIPTRLKKFRLVRKIFKLDNEPKEQQDGSDAWGSRFQFLLGTIGSAIGFGNIIRFPFITYRYGGGAFLIAYVFALFCLGIPLALLELSLGSISRKSTYQAFRHFNEKTKGIALAAVFICAFTIMTYYCVILSWICVYFVYIFQSPLPWVDNPSEFFFDVVLQASSGPLHLTSPFFAWKPLVGLIFVWLCVFLCIFKGVKGSGIITVITVPLPILMMLILFFRIAFLPGAWEGMKYYLKPDLKLLGDPRIWVNACGQIFFSIGLAAGILPSYASFTKKGQDIVQDTWIVCLTNSCFSLFSGSVVFLILGFMARTFDTTVDEIAVGGYPLAFITLPLGVSSFPVPQLFAALLFMTLFLLGIDSAFALAESVVSLIHGSYPKVPKWLIALVVSLAGLFCGVPLTLVNGYYTIDIIDHYISEFGLIVVGLAQCIAVGYFFSEVPLKDKWRQGKGLWKKITIVIFHSIEDYRMKIITKLNPTPLWSFLVKYFIPIVLGILFIESFIKENIHPYNPVEEGSTYFYPSLIVGYLILAIVFCCMFIGFISCKKRKNEELKDEIDVFGDEEGLDAFGDEETELQNWEEGEEHLID